MKPVNWNGDVLCVSIVVRWDGLDEALDARVLVGFGRVVVLRVELQQRAVRRERARAAAAAARAARPVHARAAPRARHEPEPAHQQRRRAAARHRVPHHDTRPYAHRTTPVGSYNK